MRFVAQLGLATLVTLSTLAYGQTSGTDPQSTGSQTTGPQTTSNKQTNDPPTKKKPDSGKPAPTDEELREAKAKVAARTTARA